MTHKIAEVFSDFRGVWLSSVWDTVRKSALLQDRADTRRVTEGAETARVVLRMPHPIPVPCAKPSPAPVLSLTLHLCPVLPRLHAVRSQQDLRA
jgi:hypothetical protein